MPNKYEQLTEQQQNDLFEFLSEEINDMSTKYLVHMYIDTLDDSDIDEYLEMIEEMQAE